MYIDHVTGKMLNLANLIFFFLFLSFGLMVNMKTFHKHFTLFYNHGYYSKSNCFIVHYLPLNNLHPSTV